MAKQLNSYEVKLDFKADTSQAKKEIQQFQQQLTNLTVKGAGQYNFGKDITKDLSGAISTVNQLKTTLQEAFNVDTGKLDLGKFQESMNRSGNSLNSYREALTRLGPEGKQAFNQLVNSISEAEAPLKRSSALLTEFWTTLKNTARWQISSSLLHGFMGSIQGAYRYAQDLNESLNNIRIVTGYNVDKMSDFAAAANKAAQALSTTTTSYTDAALIYYQQGLSDEEVLGRTDVTIKLANVARESAETVSDQMTAVWNNFYNGSKSLEYYADVMTALGAATASSTAEISQGLEKFAAVADTVGLSYEYATAALATVTATTRQSADIVGTAFKTLFARLEQLKLGETLDDGTTLGQYSQALEKVGVNIKDSAGNLKDMDDILDELAAKWQTLAKDQQVALAQQVAGVRQYTQLIALMDNWDFMESNLEVARGAEGTLEEQAAIYAESWEAAQKRVKAAAEDIYDALINDKFFIELNDLLANILKGIKSFTDSIGGLKGVLSSLGVIALTVFRDQIGKSINDIIYNIKSNTGVGRQSMLNFQQNAIMERQQSNETNPYKTTLEKNTFAQVSALENDAQLKLLKIKDQISERERENLNLTLKQLKAKNDELLVLSKEVVKLEQIAKKKTTTTASTLGLSVNDLAGLKNSSKTIGTIGGKDNILWGFLDQSFDPKKGGNEVRKNLQQVFNSIDWSSIKVDQSAVKFLRQNILTGHGSTIKKELNKILSDSLEYNIDENEVDRLAQLSMQNTKLTEGTKQYTKELERRKSLLREVAVAEADAAFKANEHAEGLKSQSRAYEAIEKSYQRVKQSNATMTDSFIAIANAGMSVSSIISTIQGLGSIWSNEEISLGQKMLQTMSGIGMLSTILLNLKRLEIAGNIENIRHKLTDITVSAMKTAGIEAENQGIRMNTAELIANKIAIEGVTAASVIFIAKVLLVVAALTLLTVAIYKSIKSANDFTDKIKESEKITEKLQENYESLKQSAEEFADATKDYQEGVKALKELKDNQEEYNKSLEESNKKARDLIETYGLYSQYHYDENGAIIINEEALLSKQEALDSQTNTSEMLILRSKAYTNNLINLQNINNNSEKLNEAIEDLYRQLNPQNAGINYGFDQSENLSNAFNDFAEEINTDTFVLQDFNQYLEKNNIALKGIGTEIDENVFTALQEYCESLRAVSDSNQHFSEQILRATVENSDAGKRAKELATINGVFNSGIYENLINALTSENSGKVTAQLENLNLGAGTKYNLEALITQNSSAAQEFFGNLGVDSTNLESWDLRAVYGALVKGGTASQYRGGGGLKQDEVLDALTGQTLIDNTSIELMIKTIMQQFAVYAASKTEDLSEEVIGTYNDLVAQSTSNPFNIDFKPAIAAALASNPDNFIEGFDVTTILNQITPELYNQLLKTSDFILDSLFGSGFGEKLKSQLKEIDISTLVESINETYRKRAEDLDLDVDAFEAYRRILKETNPVLAENIELLNKVAIADKRVERGAKTLIDNWEEWNEIITRVGDNSQDLSDILPEIEEALADIANVNVEDIQELDPSFISKNWDLITQSINGSETALDELQEKIASVTLENWLISIGVEDEAVRLGLQDLHAEIASFDDFPIEVPIDPLDNSDFIAKCNEMIQAAGMTSAMAQEYFSKMGFDAKFKKEKKTAYEEVADLQYTYDYDPQGNPTYRRVTPKYKKVPHDIEVLAIESITPNKSYGGNIKSLGGGGGGGSKSSGGGGKSTTPAENQKITSKADAGIERYKEIDDAIEDLTKDQERLNKVTDAYYGANKISYMKQQLQLLGKEVELHKERFKWAQEYYNEDKADLDNFAKTTLGVEIEYDEDGSIKNYTSIMDQLYSQLNEKEKYWANAANFSSKEAQDEYKKANIDPIADSMKEFQKYVDTFDESNEERKKEMNEVIALQIEYKEHEYEIWQEGWKMQQEIIEDQIKFLDHAKKMLGDSAVEMGEILALTYGNDNNYIQNTTDQLELYREKEEELHQLLEENKITQADYVDGMMEIRDQYLSLTENLKELDDFMMEYYGKTLQKVSEEVDEYTDRMDKLNDQLERYQKVMKLTGRELDYAGMDKILKAQQSIYQDQYKVDAAQLESLRKREQEVLNRLKAAGNDPAAKEMFERQLKETRDEIVEYENKVLDDLANVMEKAQDIIENSRAEAMAKYEEMMTDGLGFDYIDGLLERQSTLQDEYLTKTNQVFETTKMLRKIQSDMDATNNRAAKQRLSNFSKEIEDLKNRESMTKADLELAQKRYDLLLAEIALEEAQKAKTTVRLQRDNEGNYGYVYTADEGDIAKAQDDLFNAENDLYNTRLRITNEYGEKLIQLEQEQADALNELWDAYYNKHSISEDEYYQKRDEIRKHYADLRATYAHNYTVAQQNDARVVADAWINQDQKMIASSTDWEKNTNRLIAQTEEAFMRYEGTSDYVRGRQEYHLGTIREETEKVTTASDELKDEIKDKLKGEYEDLWKKVDAVYLKYKDERREVLQNITAYGNYATALQTVIDKYRALAEAQNIKTFNSDGDKKDTSVEVKGISSNQSVSTGNGGGLNNGGNTYTPPSNSVSVQKPVEDSTLKSYISTMNTNIKGLSTAGVDYILGHGTKAQINSLKTKLQNQYDAISIMGNMERKDAGIVSWWNTLRSWKNAGKFATGGYTGEWNDNSGKLAVLHSKELVLNAKDTENMLAIVDMVREITKTIDVNAAGVIGGYGALSSGSMNAGPQTLEQNVQITASFPNATDHNEIEEAFNNLINKASQYANRTR